MCRLLRRIVAAGLMMGGTVGCATMPGSIAGQNGVATTSIMPAVHWAISQEDPDYLWEGRPSRVEPIPMESIPRESLPGLRPVSPGHLSTAEASSSVVAL